MPDAWLEFREVGLAGWAFIGFFFLLIPYAAGKAARRMKAGGFPPRKQAFRHTIAQQLAFGGLAALVAWAESIPLGVGRLGPTQVAAAAVFLALVLGVGRWRWRSAVANREHRLAQVAPRDAVERRLWMVMAIAAGVSEEFVWRGVAWALAARLTGSLVIGAAVCLAVFAMGHVLQGWKSMVIISAFAAVAHWLVWWSGGLLLAMAVHSIYDVLAGLTYGRLAEEAGIPVTESSPVT